MSERWRTWEEPIAIEPVESAIWLPGGRVLADFRIAWSPEQIERFRLGYRCMNCLEPQEVAFPEHCPLCRFPMRAKQGPFFAAEYGGEVEIRRGKNWDEELDGLEERRRKEDEKRARS